MSEADTLIICVPTPLDKHREPGLLFILMTVEALRPGLRRGQIVSCELIREHSKVVDTRGRYRQPFANVVRA